MRWIRISALMLLAWGSVSLPVQAQVKVHGASLLPAESLLNRQGLTRRWWAHTTINSKRDKVLFLTVDESTLFVQTSAGIISAFDSESGKHLWSRSVGPADRAVFQATLNDELLFVVNGLRLFGVEKRTGGILWEIPLPGQPSSSPAADAGRVYIGFLDGSLYAFDLAQIRQMNNEGRLSNYTKGAVAWRFQTSRPIAIPAVPEGKLVAFASRNGSLYSVGAQDHKLIFQFETDAALSSPIATYRNNLLLASEDANFYSLNLLNGRPGWLFTAGLVIRKAPVVIDDEVYLIPERGYLHRLSAETGKETWRFPGVEWFVAASTSHVYGMGHHTTLNVLSRATGELLGTVPLGLFKKFVINDRSDRLFLATDGGVLMCLTEIGRDFPRFHLHPENQPILPDFANDGYESEPAPEGMPEGEAPPEEPATEDSPFQEN
jgi:outer membrane protein assembly factor BamB